MLQEEFEEYAEKAKTLPDSTSNENKLILYGLYKQATVGNVNTRKYISDSYFCFSFSSSHCKFVAWMKFLVCTNPIYYNAMVQYYSQHG